MRRMILSTFVLPALMISGSAIAAYNTPTTRQIAPPVKAVAALAAVIGSDGTFIRGHKGASAAYEGTGTYIVHLSAKSIAGCVFTATLGTTGSSGVVSPGFITVAGASADAGGVFVQTYNADGALTDSSFHLLASC